MKYVICYSGGASSSECALSVVKKYGKENVILLNHDISPIVEQSCTKKLKKDVAEYLGMEITYANHKNWETATPIKVCLDAKAWKSGRGPILCTNRLKTEPFKQWMDENDPNKENVYVYGFDMNEQNRINRRSQIMGQMGYQTMYPMTWDESEIVRLSDIGIDPGKIYDKFNHSNCMGCLKAGWQHWYIVYCERPDIWKEAKEAEDEIGYAIHKDQHGPVYLDDKEPMFLYMKALGVKPTEKVNSSRFWADAKKKIGKYYNHELAMLSKHDEDVCLDCTL